MVNQEDLNQNSSRFGSNNQGTKKEVIDVHAMPKKFIEATQKTGHLSRGSFSSGGHNGRKLLLVAISLILVIILVIGGIWFYLDQNKPLPENVNNVQVNNQNINSNKNTNSNSNTNQNNNQNVNDNDNVNTNDNVNQNSNANDNVNSNTNQNNNQNVNDNDNVNTNDNQNFNINDNYDNQLSMDFDSDGLTAEEEYIFGTDPNLDDTDSDGYKDGQEIVSLYNPLVPAQDLFSSGMVRRFIPANQQYTFLRPSSWVAKISGGDLDSVIILPDSESGTQFIIDARLNDEAKDLTQVLEDILGSVSGYQNYSLAGSPAYRSINGDVVMTIHNNYIFIITNRPDPFGNIHFTAIFEMLLNSFEWQEDTNLGNL